PQRRAGPGVRPEIAGRRSPGDPVQQLPPVRQLLVERRHVDARAAARVLEPVLPQPPRVAERTVEIDGDRGHCRTRSHTSNPATIPTASIATSTGVPWRPCTKRWWNSSLAAAASAAKNAGSCRPSAR